MATTSRVRPTRGVRHSSDDSRTISLKDEFKAEFLWGHKQGEQIREWIERQLEVLASEAVLVVDLKGIQAVDFSLANEVFGKLYRRLGSEYPGRILLLTGASDYLKGNLNAALSALGLMALVVKGTRSWDLIGKFTDTDRETLAALRRLGQATAPELAEDLGIKLTACNQRLKKLTDGGLIVRTRISAPTGGEQYVYRWPV